MYVSEMNFFLWSVNLLYLVKYFEIKCQKIKTALGFPLFLFFNQSINSDIIYIISLEEANITA
jgi:hypothetical protein